MKEQPLRKTRCPKCGAKPKPEDIARQRLSDVGYLHDDQTFECPDCDEKYTHGVPINDFDGDAEDLWCDVCDLGFMQIHRVRIPDDLMPESSNNGSGSSVGLDLKCPHHHAFDCPYCDAHIPADGLELKPSGLRICPECTEYIPKDEVPYCYYFDTTTRDIGDRGISLVGYPGITGQLNPDKEYGFKAEKRT